MTDSRPNLQRKHTRTTQAKKQAQQDQGVSITLDGRTYTVMAGDLNALDARALRQALGHGLPKLIELLSTDPDIDLVAAVIWLARRIDGERGLTFDEVAEEIDYDAAERIEWASPGADGGEESPEG